MKRNEEQLFDKYKKLDILLKEKLSNDNGVTEYINRMDQNPKLVEKFKEDYQQLKHVRWLRNKIAHDEQSPEITKDDIKFLDRFYNDVSKGKDPLASLKKKKAKPANKGNALKAVLIVLAIIVLGYIIFRIVKG